LFKSPDQSVLKKYDLVANGYNMLIARMEPENNIETILDGVVKAKNNLPFLVVGKHDVNEFGIYLTEKYKQYKHIRFVGGIYNLEDLNNMRYHSQLYFHGHSVGGTNPSLLEAMASNALIVAHKNGFNKHILNDDAFYFETSDDIAQYIDRIDKKGQYIQLLKNNDRKIKEEFSWEHINQQYLDYFLKVYEETH